MTDPFDTVREAIEVDWYGPNPKYRPTIDAGLVALAEIKERMEALVTLIRVGFLVTVGGERATADTIANPELRALLFTILQAKDTPEAGAVAVLESVGADTATLITRACWP